MIRRPWILKLATQDEWVTLSQILPYKMLGHCEDQRYKKMNDGYYNFYHYSNHLFGWRLFLINTQNTRIRTISFSTYMIQDFWPYLSKNPWGHWRHPTSLKQKISYTDYQLMEHSLCDGYWIPFILYSKWLWDFVLFCFYLCLQNRKLSPRVNGYFRRPHY